MATRIVRESDLSGELGASPVRFGLEDQWYEVDLTDLEAADLLEVLGRYVGAGRPAAPPRARVVPETTVEEREAIRTWAREAGFTLAERGRIPLEIYDAYGEAHGIDFELRSPSS